MAVIRHKHSLICSIMIVETRPAIITKFKEEVKECEEKSKKAKNPETIVTA